MEAASSSKPKRRAPWARLLALAGILMAGLWVFAAMRGGRVNPFVTLPPRYAASAPPQAAGAGGPLGGIFESAARKQRKPGTSDPLAEEGEDMAWAYFPHHDANWAPGGLAAWWTGDGPIGLGEVGSAGGGQGSPGQAGTGFRGGALLAATFLGGAPSTGGGSSSGGSPSVGASSGGGAGSSGGVSSSGGPSSPDVPATPPAGTIEIPAPVVPEPATWLAMLAGFGSIGIMLRLRRRSTQSSAIH